MKSDRTSPIPQSAIEDVEWASRHLGLESGGGRRVAIALRNTIGMRHARLTDGEDSRVILDWSHLERVLVFGRFFWSLQGDRLWRQKVSGFLEQEVFLAASRFALLEGHHAAAGNLHEAYVGFEFGDLIPHGCDVAAQAREHSWYVAFAAFREFARPHAIANMSQVHEWLGQISPDVPGNRRPDDESLVEAYLDHTALNEILGRDPRTVGQGLIGELLLYVAIDELVRVTRFVAPHVGTLVWLDEAVAHSSSFAHDWRFEVIRAHAHYCASRIEESDVADRVRAEMDMATDFPTLLTNGMHHGLGLLKRCNPAYMSSMAVKTGLRTELLSAQQKRDIEDMIMAFVDEAATTETSEGVESA
ncbi:MAG TPA: hypothetical protein VN231_06815 [Allosphingosinicella sp.]|nr:hypothetical protein [Allosphingosinicella sp.]